ncbi:hypothetical protein SAMN02744124_02151 [Paenibacillus barengoltzii J12]|jgi:hypothetical protein|uniref:Uncharacterized protein n=2 Tax=Paenibacillus barengoltzii TaxID=343517 RepID=R9LG61_9BACL|nr:hypothetical protein C812_01646 [Paenibacillus barengoltzii G22]SME90310.1 hypothetical protein SAMN02744102_00190 [Paenibacillus barengoltzii]SMF26491.1 hypothetical protein SAMN02744124_02151 [Paenibacillus barengoltzii J12]
METGLSPKGEGLFCYEIWAGGNGIRLFYSQMLEILIYWG